MLLEASKLHLLIMSVVQRIASQLWSLEGSVLSGSYVSQMIFLVRSKLYVNITLFIVPALYCITPVLYCITVSLIQSRKDFVKRARKFRGISEYIFIVHVMISSREQDISLFYLFWLFNIDGSILKKNTSFDIIFTQA